MGGGKGGTSSSSVSIPPEVLARYNSVNARAETAASTPFQPYTGQFVAGLTPTQQAGISGTNNYSQAAQPYYQAATQGLMSAQNQALPAINQAYGDVGAAQGVGSAYAQGAESIYNQANQTSQPYYQGATQGLLSAQNQALPAINQAYGDVTNAQGIGTAYGAGAETAYNQAAQMAQPYYQAATQGLGASLANAAPYQQAATAYAMAGGQGVNANQLQTGQYFDPYAATVAGTTYAALQQQQGQDRSRLAGQQASTGAFGGDRAGLERANLARQQSLGTAQAISPILSQAYQQALQTAQQQQGVGLGAAQANRAAVASAGQQLAGLGQQGYQQQLGASQQAAALGQGLFGQGMQLGQAYGGLGQQQFGQGMSAAQQKAALGNQIYGMGSSAAQQLAGLGQQQFAQGAQLGQAYSGLGQQQFGQGMSTAQQRAALGNQIFGMGSTASQQLAGLGTGAQAAGLQGAQQQLAAGTAEQQTGQADLTAQYQQFLQQQGYPYQQAQFLANIAMGTGALSGSSTTSQQPSGFFSDRRLKHDVHEIGKTHDGQPIYSYKYNGDNKTQIGLMAQDVEKHHPDAVGVMGGYKTVDYGKATEDSERPERAAGGVIPNSMGGGVWHPDAYAGGGLVDSEDMKSILQAQQAGFGPFSHGPGGLGAGTPGGKSQGVVPQASLPVPKLVTASTPAARQASGMTQAASTGANIANTGKAAVDFKNWVSGLGKDKPAETTVTKTSPAAGVTGKADIPSVKAAPTEYISGERNPQGFAVVPQPEVTPPDATPDLEGFFAKGGVIPYRYHRSSGGINPYELSDDMSYIPKSVLKEGEDEADQAAGQFKKNTSGGGGGGGGGGLGEALGVAKSAFDVGKFLLPFFLKEGGVVPRHGYALDGTVVDESSDQPAYDPRADMPSENARETAYTSDDKFIKPVKEVSNNVDEAQAIIDRAREVHAQKESGGDYGIKGPVIPKGPFAGQRPIGRYQVMEGNIGPWTKIALGKEFSPEEFRQNKEAQDAVFNKIWGDNYRKYGNVPDAVSMWASGRPAAEGAKTRDLVFGTSTGAYIDDATRKILGKDYKAPEPGVSRSSDIGRSSTLGDVFSKMTPESIPSNENFWIPALSGIGSMLASNRPTLLGAVGEGLVGGVSGYQTMQKQHAEMAKGVMDLIKDRFVTGTDKTGNTTFYDKVLGKFVDPSHVQGVGASMLSNLGINPKAYGFGSETLGATGTSTSPRTVAGGPSAPSAPIPAGTEIKPPGAAPSAPSEVKTETAPPIDKNNLFNKSESELIAIAKQRPDLFPGLTGDRDPRKLQAEIDQQKRLGEELSARGQSQQAIYEKQDAFEKQKRLDEYLKQAVDFQYKQNEKIADASAKTYGDYKADVDKRAANYSSHELKLKRLADINADFQSGAMAAGQSKLLSYLKGTPLERALPSDWKDQPGQYGEAYKLALAEALQAMSEDKLVRAPKIGAEKEMAKVPSPDSDPAAVYAIIGSSWGDLLKQKQMDAEFAKAPPGTNPGDFAREWSKRNDTTKFYRDAFNQITPHTDISPKAIRSLQETYRSPVTGETFTPAPRRGVTEGAPAATSAPAVSPGNTIGEERQFKQGIGVWNGTTWVPKGR
jgi:hypothetical protein